MQLQKRSPKYNIDNIPDTKVIPFWKTYGDAGVCCQWYKSDFTDSTGVKYICMEQYMMAHKALLFNDTVSYNKIMKENNPANIQKLGRGVKNFNDKVWNDYKYSIVFEGNCLKFTQNTKLKQWLKNTEDAILVEASPFDGVWGVRMDAGNPDIGYPDMWRGQNLLGFAIMEVRDIL